MMNRASGKGCSGGSARAASRIDKAYILPAGLGVGLPRRERVRKTVSRQRRRPAGRPGNGSRLRCLFPGPLFSDRAGRAGPAHRRPAEERGRVLTAASRSVSAPDSSPFRDLSPGLVTRAISPAVVREGASQPGHGLPAYRSARPDSRPGQSIQPLGLHVGQPVVGFQKQGRFLRQVQLQVGQPR